MNDDEYSEAWNKTIRELKFTEIHQGCEDCQLIRGVHKCPLTIDSNLCRTVKININKSW